MKLPRQIVLSSIATCILVAAATSIQAQQIQTTGTPGSPGGTTTISGKQLPAPDPKFGGVIKDGALQSEAWWAPRIVPPKQAPNILVIMTDDCGFGAPSTFGGVIPTPALDRVGKSGLRYTCMHSTALCSPTRAALITGRNHHSVGFGVVSEQSTGFPGYNSIIAKDKATIGRILLDNGFATSWFGKDHNTPTFTASQAGPFAQWPTGMGFEYFYGFVGGDTKETPQFGLIAEEVAKVNPALVLPDKEGKPYTVRYDAVNAMLLNEFLKEHRKVQQLQAMVAQQQKDFEAALADLKGQIQRGERAA